MMGDQKDNHLTRFTAENVLFFSVTTGKIDTIFTWRSELDFPH